jgi:hypothetical protein
VVEEMNGYNSRRSDWWRNAFLLVALAFAVTFAIIIGQRMSSEAMAVLVGALCGVSATVPVSLALIIAINRDWGRREPMRRNDYEYDQPMRPPQPQQPQIVVIAPPQAAQWQYGYPTDQTFLPPTAPSPGAPREFKIVGEE